MKFLRQVLAMCFLVGAWGGYSAVLAATETQPAAEKKEAPKDVVLKGDAKCTACHDEADAPRVLHIGKTRHGVVADGRAPTCTSCHGDSVKHIKDADGGIKNPTKPDVTFGAKSQVGSPAKNNACLTCHDKDANRDHWAGSLHQRRDVACTSCHEVHVQDDRVLSKVTQAEVCFACHKTERAQTHRMSTHPIGAGKVSCSDCHNPHGSTGPKLLVKDSVNETCFTCHAEKRGPFLFEHASANDDCMNCHTPHGSTNAPLLKARSPWLCQQCHSGTTPHPGNVYSATGLPGGAVANATQTVGTINPITGVQVTKNNPPAQLAFRGCTNCHSQVHGSNHPAGVYLLR